MNDDEQGKMPADPTVLTTQRVLREVTVLKELIASEVEHIQTILDERDKRFAQRFNAQEHALTMEVATTSRLQVEISERYDQRFQAQEHAVEIALSRVDKEFHEHLANVREETRAALNASDKAVTKAEDATDRAISEKAAATDKRFDAVNEFRGQLSEIISTFIPRIEAEARLARNGDDIAKLNSRLDQYEGRDSGSAVTKAGMYAAIAAVGTILGILILLANGVLVNK